jgi:cytochrome c-type biogenesis protein CcmH/NrfF
VTARRALAAALALVALAGATPLTSAIANPSPAPRTSLPAVEKEVMCPVCGLPLNVSQSPQADRERAYIRSLIAQGYTKDQVKRALVGQFGPAVLALPSRSGFDLVVYIVPVIVVAALAAAVALLLPRWRRRARAQAAAAPGRPEPQAGISPAEAARLDEELARYDR